MSVPALEVATRCFHEFKAELRACEADADTVQGEVDECAETFYQTSLHFDHCEKELDRYRGEGTETAQKRLEELEESYYSAMFRQDEAKERLQCARRRLAKVERDVTAAYRRFKTTEVHLHDLTTNRSTSAAIIRTGSSTVGQHFESVWKS